MNRWFETSYRRNLVDMHIEDWNPEFLSEFDPEVYAELLKTAHVKSVMLYMTSHLGYCYWPTKSGYVHKQMHGDKMGRLIELCHAQGMDVILYMSLLVNNWAYDNHPEWRNADQNGRSPRDEGVRFGGCCPNSIGYRQFVDEQVREICTGYKAEGVFFDMAGSIGMCYCDSCRERYRRETGGKEIPTRIDWNDPDWVEYQRIRKAWGADFAQFAYDCVKKYNPELTVEHNSSPFRLIDWRMGCSMDTIRANDYIGGDIYGEPIEQSLTCKFFDSITPNKPFEFMTSRCSPHLANHTTTKMKSELELNAFYSLAHNGAFMFIDAIDPKGTMNPLVYELMGEIFGRMERCEPYAGGVMRADVGMYLSMESDFKEDDTDLTNLSAFYKPGIKPHLDGLHGATKVFKEKNVPFGVLTRNALDTIRQYQVVFLPDINVMSGSEQEALQKYVRDGGSLYISGSRLPELTARFGIKLNGKTRESVTYVVPAKAGESVFSGVNLGSPLMVDAHQSLVERDGIAPEEVLGTITLPYTDPKDRMFASIHSNPPGKDTEEPAIVYKKHGRGAVIWTSAGFEVNGSEPHKELFYRLIIMLAKNPLAFESTAPKPVEIINDYQADSDRHILHILNAQEQLPPIPVADIRIKLNTGGKRPARVRDIETGDVLDAVIDGEFAAFTVPCLDIYKMIEVKM